MTFNLTAFNQDIYDLLAPLRQELQDAEIPVAVLPKEANAYKANEDSGHITIVFRESERLGDSRLSTKEQEVQLRLEIRVSLSDRYTNDPTVSNAAIEWVLDRLVGLIIGHRPPFAEAYWFEGHTLYPPEAGRWEVDARFSCMATLIPPVEPVPLVEVIKASGSIGKVNIS
ncbi:MAG: hypothetical protein F6K14_10785 [Symploca sp. SIO2C1]|nr:hypothetical protein [Symploca sp. SIO2C1]